ncbi:MAG: gliding motility-associated C-terminal domain-containing protein [Bacteroidia bacterium]|nr:gliding motility-associated C-terminal domain-containing protein [Bacteroidia bacterium]
MTPGFTGTPVYSPSSTIAVSVPGTYTALIKDNTSGCASKVPMSILQNTTSPKWDTLIIPTRILDCYKPTMVLEAISSNVHTQYNWSFPGVLGNVFSNTIAVNANTANVTSSVIANYTFLLTDTINLCVTQTVIPLFQNLYPPKAKFSLSGNQISCLTTSITLTNQSTSGIPPGSIFPVAGPAVAYYWYPPIPQPTLQLSTTYKAKWPGIYVMVARDAANGCTASTSSIIADTRVHPVINSPLVPPPFVMPCGGQHVTIKPILKPDDDYNYRWYVPPGAVISDANKLELLTSGIGTYTIVVTNKVNGCVSTGTVEVINDTLQADFTPLPDRGFAPLPVLFNNLSTSKTGTSGIVTVWGFGNGNTILTDSASVKPQTNYYQPGIYTVTAFAIKGTCMDTVKKIITVDLPSMLQIPNVFTPNGDGINDTFFLKTAGLQSINITIYDRWGNKVYNTLSFTGNINWDGKNQYGINVADGIYFYLLEATGNDGKSFERKGNITLLR